MNRQDLWLILAVLPLLFLATMALDHWLGSFLVSYRLTASAIEVRFLQLVRVRWIKYSNIADIRQVTWHDPAGIRSMLRLLWCWFGAWNNRIFVKSFVLIEPKRSFIHRIVITPNDPGAFVDRVRTLMARNEPAIRVL